MDPLVTLLIFMLQIKAALTEETFYRIGQSVVLRCTTDLSQTCGDVDWLYNRDGGVTLEEVRKGNIEAESGRAARLSVNADCSLIINNISAEDYGRYTCRLWDRTDLDTIIYLSILTVSPSPPDADTGNYEVTLECSLTRYRDLGQCKPNSIRWMDERRTELTGKGVGYELSRLMNCVSYLTVSLQRANSRMFTCQFVEENRVLVEAHYPPVPAVTLSTTSVPTTAHPPKLQPPRDTFIWIGAAVGVGLVLLFITIAILIKFRRKGGATEEQKAPADALNSADQQIPPNDEPESNVTYASVHHPNQTSSSKMTDEDTVTYSVVRLKAEAVIDPGSLYASVSRPE
ncbi:uncharacterized protein ACNS7B_001974 isoform 2-T2 [Menidia menidia]